MTSRLLVFDSGLGGLSVHRALCNLMPQAETIYVADDAAFPYGDLDDQALEQRVQQVMTRLLPEFEPDLVVIACNTASTLVLPHLRSRFDLPFVGTVPAIKPAAESSESRRIAILATPATVKREYTQALIREFAGDCEVILHAPPQLASRAERFFAGETVRDADVWSDIAPCFVDRDGRRTDRVVLGCTHYPLLLEPFERLAPWPVQWIDPAPAIARRVLSLLDANRASKPCQKAHHQHVFINTGMVDLYGPLRAPLESFGFTAGETRAI
jgi:glutamate racemase